MGNKQMIIPSLFLNQEGEGRGGQRLQVGIIIENGKGNLSQEVHFCQFKSVRTCAKDSLCNSSNNYAAQTKSCPKL